MRPEEAKAALELDDQADTQASQRVKIAILRNRIKKLEAENEALKAELAWNSAPELTTPEGIHQALDAAGLSLAEVIQLYRLGQTPPFNRNEN